MTKYSLSMSEHNLGFFTMEILIIVSTEINNAVSGKLNVCGIKEEDMEIYHSGGETFSKEKAAFILSKFKFDFSSRMSHDLAKVNFLKGSITMLETQSKKAKAKQIVFVISQCRFNKNNVL